jgi:hypothetical protein
MTKRFDPSPGSHFTRNEFEGFKKVSSLKTANWLPESVWPAREPVCAAQRAQRDAPSESAVAVQHSPASSHHLILWADPPGATPEGQPME